MDLLKKMNDALNYIEDNMLSDIDYSKVARVACCSVYNFQRMFSFITDVSLSEYIRRRRLTLAAFEFQDSNVKVIDLALKYGYESPEAFARAFQNIHGVTPTVARNMGVELKAYPRLSFHISIKGAVEMNYRIEKKEAFTIFGVEGVFTTENEKNLVEIPKFWSEAMENGTIDKIADATGENWNNKHELCSVNAVCDYREIGGSRFAYMLCAFKTSKSVTEGFTVVDIPAATWAIFTSEEYGEGEIASATQDLVKRVYTEWLPTAGYEKLDGYEFEMYYTKENGKNYTETWIRVAKKVYENTY
ncbi:MAG: AraC family transcriptional regulator [Clostridium sp.]|uniref:AraC family transcriptional regulator n=1 Tax=Clostridium sp. TaxID=1506 RepID=UPI003D6CCD36